MDSLTPKRETLTTSEVMELLDVSRPTVTRLLASGVLEGYKINPHVRNSHLRIYRDSVEQFLEERNQSKDPPTLLEAGGS